MFLPSAYQQSWLATQHHLQYIPLLGLYYFNAAKIRLDSRSPGHSQEPAMSVTYVWKIEVCERMAEIICKLQGKIKSPKATAYCGITIHIYFILFHILAWCFLIFICTPYMVPNHRQPDCRYNPSKKKDTFSKADSFPSIDLKCSNKKPKIMKIIHGILAANNSKKNTFEKMCKISSPKKIIYCIYTCKHVIVISMDSWFISRSFAWNNSMPYPAASRPASPRQRLRTAWSRPRGNVGWGWGVLFLNPKKYSFTNCQMMFFQVLSAMPGARWLSGILR